MTSAKRKDFLDEHDLENQGHELNEDFLTLYISNQLFGIPVLQVQDVLGTQRVTRIPLAPPEVAGALNLRGRIVTAIDVRKRLGIGGERKTGSQMSVVVEHGGELYSLIIDRVGDVLSLSREEFENNPPTLDQQWREISLGIYRLKKELLVVLDVAKVLNTVHE
ncbi:MAG: chemotaxis protein CheW [Alphaproteobacteria bacterium]|nr:chemotaxis protein CheW [Alphaproteobacteria bacterium]